VRAVDTNVVVRFLTADDAAQFKRARRVMEADAARKAGIRGVAQPA
jgi:predicted nucleic-acid-binding protein